MTGTKDADRWIDMTKYDDLLAAIDETGEKAIRAIDWSLELLDWLSSAAGHSVVRQHVDTYAHSKWEDSPELAHLDHEERTAAMTAYWMNSVQFALDEGQTFYVTPRMCALARAIADEMIDLPIFPTDVPCETGVFWLQTPLHLFDYVQEAVKVPIRAIVWRTTSVTVQTEERKPLWPIFDEPIVLDVEAHSGLQLQCIARASEITTDKVDPEDILWARWVPFETTGWRFGTEWRALSHEETQATIEDGLSAPYGTCVETLGTLRRFMLALFTLCAQEVAVVEPFRPDRHARRRVARLSPNFGDVKVVRLRRIFDPLVELSEEERGERVAWERHWTHRWVVREHWAWRACGPDRADRRRVLIRSYVKGPEDLPLIEKDTVYSLER